MLKIVKDGLYFYFILCGMMMNTLLLVQGMIWFFEPGSNYMSPSKEAAYIPGEKWQGGSCVIDMYPGRTFADMNQDYIWCGEKHLDYLSSLKK